MHGVPGLAACPRTVAVDLTSGFGPLDVEGASMMPVEEEKL